MNAIPPLAAQARPPVRVPRTARAPRPGAVLASFVVAALAMGLSQQGASGVIQDQVRAFDTTVDVIGYAIMAYALGVVVGAPVIMVGLAAWDRRRLMVGASALFVVTSLFTLFAPTVELLIASRFLNGLPHGVLLGTAAFVGVQVMGPERRGRAIAMTMYGLTAAAIAGVPAMQWLSDQAGWRASYLVVTLVGVAGLAMLWAFVPSVPGTATAGFRSELATLKGAALWTAIVTVTFGFAGFGAVQSYLVPLLEDLNGFSGPSVTLTLMLFGLGLSVGAVLGGRLTDRSVSLTTRVGVIGVAIMLGVLGLFGGSGWPVAIIVILLGVVVQIFAQAVAAHLMDVIHTSPSLGAALSHAALNAAQVLGAGLGAVVIGLGWGLLAPAWVAFVFTLFAVVLAYVGPGFRRR